jgi:cobalt-zinc-cadmium efflux system protein
MGESHSHHQHEASGKVLRAALVITFAYAAVELAAGLFANSLALIGDAGHMVTDSMALAIGALAAWMATRPRTQRHTYGFQRAEVLGALFNVLFMYLVVALIAISAVERIQQPVDVDFSTVMLVGGIGLIINIIVAYLLSRGAHTLNSRAALLHVMGDMLGSVAAIIAGAVIWVSGWMLIDPLLSLLICVLITVSSTRLLLETINVLMEAVPSDVNLDELSRKLESAHPNIVGVHHLHVWTVSSSTKALSAHLEISEAPNQAEIIDQASTAALDDFDIGHSTFQLEVVARCKSDTRLETEE